MRDLEVVELGGNEVIVEITDQDSIAEVTKALGHEWTWTALEGPTVIPGEEPGERASEWITLIGAKRKEAQPRDHRAA